MEEHRGTIHGGWSIIGLPWTLLEAHSRSLPFHVFVLAGLSMTIDDRTQKNRGGGQHVGPPTADSTVFALAAKCSIIAHISVSQKAERLTWCSRPGKGACLRVAAAT